MLIPFRIRVEVTGVSFQATTAVGFSVDEPLPSQISGTKYAIGIVTLYPFVTNVFETTITVNVGNGKHYVVLGIEPPAVTISALRFVLQGAGTSIDRTLGVADPLQFVYIAFEVRDTAVTPVSSGLIAPGASPIAEPGGGGIFPGDPTNAIGDLVGVMLQFMLPIMMLNMMVGMVGAMVQSMSVRMI